MRIAAILMLVLSLAGCAQWVQFGHTDPGHQPGSAPNAPLLPGPAGADAPQSGPAAGEGTGQIPVQPPAAAAPVQGNAAAATGGNPAPAAAQGALAVRDVVLRLSARARQQIAADPRFSGEALRAAVTRELGARGLLLTHDTQVHAILQITLDGFTTAPAANTVVFGYTFSNAVLVGQVSLRDAGGGQRPAFTVHARQHLASRAHSPDAHPFDPLYRRFAVLAVDDLLGVAETPAPMPR